MLIEPTSLRNDAELLRLPITSARASIAYLLTAHRNAWHSTMISRFRSSEPIFTTSSSATFAAESRRVSGGAERA